MLKDYRYVVHTKRALRGIVTVESEAKPRLTVATPPEFRDGVEDVWTPEDMLVAAVATCYALTLSAIAERRSIPLSDVSVVGAGHVCRRADGIFGFVVIELAVEIITEEGSEPLAEGAARLAERGCIVNNALNVPVELELKIRTKSEAAATVA